MDQWGTLWQAAAGKLGPFAPRVLGALAILLLAWLMGRLVRAAVLRLAASRRLDERLQTPGLAALLATIAYALVWLFALPALLDALALEGLLAPVNAMMSRLLGVLPNFLGAAAIFGIGLLAARILRQLVTGLLTAAGSERLAARLGLSTALGERGLAGLAGLVVFSLVLLPTLSAALQALGLEVIAKPVAHLLDQVIELIPRLISAAVIFAIGAILGRVLAGLVTALLAGAGVNELPGRLGMPADLRVGGRDLPELGGGIAMAGVLLLATTQASEVLGFGAVTEAVAALGGVFARLIVALVVLVVGLWLGAVAARVVAASSVAHAALLGQLARAAILFFTAALALRQAGLPADIVAIAFGVVIGSIGLAVAIAVGFGGRDVAARLLETAAASFERKKNDPSGGER
jgi:hypothetical protein